MQVAAYLPKEYILLSSYSIGGRWPKTCLITFVVVLVFVFFFVFVFSVYLIYKCMDSFAGILTVDQ